MKISAFIKSCAVCFLAASALTACDNAIYDNEGDCSVHYRVKFRYDMNLKFADAFAHEVNSVTLYVFDKDGNYVTELTESGEALKQENYSMPLDLDPGDYHLVAWCGLDNGESFTVPEMHSRAATPIDQLTCRLNRQKDEKGAFSEDNLHRLFHGSLDVSIKPYGEVQEGTYYETIELTKDTNTIRVVLQHLSGEDVDVRDFSFSIEDNNGFLGFDNSRLADENIQYRPTDMGQIQAGIGPNENDPDDPSHSGTITNVRAAFAEFSVSRLFDYGKLNSTQGPKLVIRDLNDNGRVVVSLPFNDYALAIRSSNFASMDNQEFLDRADEYSMVFFLDEDNRWAQVTIDILSWRVVFQNPEINS